MRKTLIFVCCLLLATSCRDFNPVTDSSVRTVRFMVDPRDAMDSMLIEMEDTIMMISPVALPDGYCLRTEVLCYNANNELERKAMFVNDSIVPFEVTMSHIDTTKQHTFVFVTDIVKKLGNDMYQYNWPTFDPSDINTLYTMYVSSFENTTPWLNSLAFCEWSGYPNTFANPVKLKSLTCCAKLNLSNAYLFDKIRIEIGQSTSMWLHPLESRKRYWRDRCELLPTGESCQISFICTSMNSSISIHVITTKVNTVDTVTLKINTGNAPFVINYDCDTKQFETENL